MCRLRVSLSAAHSTEDVRRLAAALQRCGLPVVHHTNSLEPAPLPQQFIASGPAPLSHLAPVGVSVPSPGHHPAASGPVPLDTTARSPLDESSGAEPCEDSVMRSAPAASPVQLASRVAASTSRQSGDACMLPAHGALSDRMLLAQATGSADSLRSRL